MLQKFRELEKSNCSSGKGQALLSGQNFLFSKKKKQKLQKSVLKNLSTSVTFLIKTTILCKKNLNHLITTKRYEKLKNCQSK